jgi:hypothetical protein
MTERNLPAPGTIIIIEHTAFLDKWQLVRVVKTGKVMWEVEPVRRRGISLEEGVCFDAPCRRKVAWWKEVPPEADIADLHHKMIHLYDLQWQQKKQAVLDYKRSISTLLDEAVEA